jgi:hypothetical protein
MNRTLVACILLATTACQSYSTVALNAVPVGADVRVTLTDSGSALVAGDVGHHAERLEGKVTHSDVAGLTMSVDELTRTGGTSELGEGKLVSVPADAIATVQLQSVSVSKSLLLAGVAAAGAIAIGRSLGAGNGTSVRGSGPPGAGH